MISKNEIIILIVVWAIMIGVVIFLVMTVPTHHIDNLHGIIKSVAIGNPSKVLWA